jgi:hypothetical protein
MDLRNPILLLVVLLFLIVQPVLNAITGSLLPNAVTITALVIALLCGSCFFYFCVRQRDQPDLWASILAPRPITRRDWMVILTVFSLGAFLRLWHLGSLFEGMSWDEAYKGLDAIAIRDLHERPVYLNWNAGRDAMVAYLVAFTQMLMGTGIDSVRIVVAAAGSLSVGLFYFLLRKLFHPTVGLIGAFCMAVSKWHIIHSRYGVRVPLFPFFELLILLLFVLGLKSRRKLSIWLLLAGIATGLGFYTYIAYRVFPVVVLLFLFQDPIRSCLKQHWKSLSAALLLAIVLVLPLARFFVDHRESLTGRMNRTAVWKQKGTDAPAYSLILDATVKTLGMFTYGGDSIVRHNVNKEPMLSPFLTSFCLLGLLFCIANIRKSYAAFFLAYFLISLVPGFLSVHAPQSSRTLAAVIPAYFFVSVGLITTARIVGEHSARLKKWVVGVTLVGAMLTDVDTAMVRYPDQLDSLSSYESALYGMDRDQTEIAHLMNQLGERETIFLTPQLYFHSVIEYLTYDKTAHYVYYSRTDLNRSTYPGSVAIVFLQPHYLNLWWLRDEPDKDFFKWWRQTKGMPGDEIQDIIHDSYWTYFHMLHMSDQGLLNLLRKRHPTGKVVRFEHFDAFLYRP